MAAQDAPLYGPPPAEVPLPRAPLASVLWQVRFPSQGGLVPRQGEFSPEAVTNIQKDLKSAYPIFERQFGHSIELSDGKPEIQAQDGLWRFSSIDKKWHVTMARNFVSLQTDKYTSRSDFIARAGVVLESIRNRLDPGAATRIGVRYVNRVPLAGVDICKMVRPPVFGFYGDAKLQAATVHSAAEALVMTEEGSLVLKSLVLPPNATHEPSVLEPGNEQAWILDLDLFSAEPREFDVAALEQAISSYCKRIYAVFCWLVEDDFITHFGGKK